ncbi:MAG: histone deacetylase family protein [Alphaproteobacteria bacterium]|nr:histone deacetylase family protein [Alphaproteobacteria bacterium]
MTTGLFSSSACLYHEPPLGHPESPDRLRAVLHALEGEAFQFLQRFDAPPAAREDLERLHGAAYVDAILAAVPQEGHAHIDADTVLSPGSREAALRAAGAVTAAVDAVIAGDVQNAFCAVRPPGHHAEPHQAMGFCLFNNIAVGALRARAVHGLKRIAVIDFDVHHGNGTQAAFESDPDLFYGSTHQAPLYPGTGHPRERGIAGNIVNAALRPGASGPEFREAMDAIVLPALEAFSPELVLVSAGFDAHRLDPLANLGLTEADFGWITERLARIARQTCGGRLVSSLEGGYNLTALADSASAHVKALMEA